MPPDTQTSPDMARRECATRIPRNHLQVVFVHPIQLREPLTHRTLRAMRTRPPNRLELPVLQDVHVLVHLTPINSRSPPSDTRVGATAREHNVIPALYHTKPESPQCTSPRPVNIITQTPEGQNRLLLRNGQRRPRETRAPGLRARRGRPSAGAIPLRQQPPEPAPHAARTDVQNLHRKNRNLVEAQTYQQVNL